MAILSVSTHFFLHSHVYVAVRQCEFNIHLQPVTNTLSLFYLLAKFLIITSETELDCYLEKLNLSVTSRVAERLGNEETLGKSQN